MRDAAGLPYTPLTPYLPEKEGEEFTTYVISDLHLGWRVDWPEGEGSDNPFGGEPVANEAELAEFLSSLVGEAGDPDTPRVRLIVNGDIPDLERCDPAGCLAYASEWADEHLKPLKDAGADLWWVVGNHDYTLWVLAEEDPCGNARRALEGRLHVQMAYPRLGFESNGKRFCVTHGDVVDMGMAFHKVGTPPGRGELRKSRPPAGSAVSGPTPPEQPPDEREWRHVSRWSRWLAGGIFRGARWYHLLDFNRWILTVEPSGTVQEVEAFYKQPPWVIVKLFAEFLTSGFGRNLLGGRGRRAFARLSYMIVLVSWLVRQVNRLLQGTTEARKKTWPLALWGFCGLLAVVSPPTLVSWLGARVDPAAGAPGAAAWGFTPLALLCSFGCLVLGMLWRPNWPRPGIPWGLAWLLLLCGVVVAAAHGWRLYVARPAAWPLLVLLVWYLLVVRLLYAMAGIFKSEDFLAIVRLRAIEQKWHNLLFALKHGWLGDFDPASFDHYAIGHFHYPEQDELLTDEGGWVGTHEFVFAGGESSMKVLPLASYLAVQGGEPSLHNHVLNGAPLHFRRDSGSCYTRYGGYWE